MKSKSKKTKTSMLQNGLLANVDQKWKKLLTNVLSNFLTLKRKNLLSLGLGDKVQATKKETIDKNQKNQCIYVSALNINTYLKLPQNSLKNIWCRYTKNTSTFAWKKESSVICLKSKKWEDVNVMNKNFRKSKKSTFQTGKRTRNTKLSNLKIGLKCIINCNLPRLIILAKIGGIILKTN